MKLWYTEFKKKTESMGSKTWYRRSVFVSSGIYVVARLFILVELFRTLCFLPADAYVSTWTTNIPHVG